MASSGEASGRTHASILVSGSVNSWSNQRLATYRSNSKTKERQITITINGQRAAAILIRIDVRARTRPSAAVFPYIVSRERSHSQRVMRVGRHHAGPTFTVGGGKNCLNIVIISKYRNNIKTSNISKYFKYFQIVNIFKHLQTFSNFCNNTSNYSICEARDACELMARLSRFPK